MKTRFILNLGQPFDVAAMRLCLLNRIAARAQQGRFLIRCENEEPEKAESFRSLAAWLSLDWDEGLGYGTPDDRAAVCERRIEELLAAGKAYPCYCSEERLKEMRSRQTLQGKRPRYDGHCRELTPEARKELETKGGSQIRVRLDVEGSVKILDAVGGERVLPKNMIEDYVIRRADGSYAKNFVRVADDIDDGVTDLIVGEDEWPNLFQQVIYWRLMVDRQPTLVLIPVLLDTDHALLSKKGEETTVQRFREEGYLPRALVRYLISCGWTQSQNYPLEELPEHYQHGVFSRASPVFDVDRLKEINGQCIQEISEEAYLELARPYGEQCSDEIFMPLAREVRPYIQVFSEIRDYVDIAVTESISIPEEILPLLRTERAKNSLAFVLQGLEGVERFSTEAMKGLVEAAVTKFKVKSKSILTPLQIALTGSGGELVLDPVPALLGKEKVVTRLRQALDLAQAPPVATS